MNSSEIKIKDILNTNAALFGSPSLSWVELSLNGKVMIDDSKVKSNVEFLKMVKKFIKKFGEYYVTKVNLTVIDFHHYSVEIETFDKNKKE